MLRKGGNTRRMGATVQLFRITGQFRIQQQQSVVVYSDALQINIIGNVRF